MAKLEPVANCVRVAFKMKLRLKTAEISLDWQIPNVDMFRYFYRLMYVNVAN